ncbi:MAG: imidazolonepropionase-like amidohydrolase, partial [Sediminicola sp.]
MPIEMKKISLLLSFAILFSCAPVKEKVSKTAILFTNANVVDVRTGQIQESQQVIIDSGKIKSIQPTIGHPEDFTTQIDAKGKYLMPGLAEMHAHIPQSPTSEERIEETLFLYLSNGITTIRGMLGHPSHLVLREK